MKVFDSYEVADAMADLLNEFISQRHVADTRPFGDGWGIVIKDSFGNAVESVDDVAETIREYMK